MALNILCFLLLLSFLKKKIWRVRNNLPTTFPMLKLDHVAFSVYTLLDIMALSYLIPKFKTVVLHI